MAMTHSLLPYLPELLVATATAAATILGVYVKQRRGTSVERKAALQSIHTTYEVKQAMRMMLGSDHVDRVLILRTHNGAGTPTPGKPLKVSAIHVETTLEDLSDAYQNIQVDAHYVGLLCTLLEDKEVPVVTNDLPRSLLKTIYQREGVQYSRWFKLVATGSGLYYCSVSSTGTGFSPEEEFAIQTGIAKLRAAFAGEE